MSRKADSLKFFNLDGRAHAWRDEHLLFEARNWPELITLASEALHNPLRLEPNAHIALEVSDGDWPTVMAALTVDDGDEEFLEAVDEADWTNSPIDWQPIDIGIEFNTEPWGWITTDQGWRLTPLTFFDDAEQLALIGAWQTESMTGSQISSAALSTNGVTLHFWEDIGIDRYVSIRYGEDRLDAFEGWIDGNFGALSPMTLAEPICPVADPSGWTVTDLQVSSAIPTAAIGRALDVIWKPCSEHSDSWGPELAGRRWHWQAGHWAPVDP